jgi:hypothetical protein
MIYFLVLAGMAKKVFKTGAFNRSAIPPFTILPDSIILRGTKGIDREIPPIQQIGRENRLKLLSGPADKASSDRFLPPLAGRCRQQSTTKGRSNMDTPTSPLTTRTLQRTIAGTGICIRMTACQLPRI